MKRLRLFYITLLVIAATSVIDLPAAEPGMLEIRIKDHREAIGDFAKLDIIIDKIAVSPKAGLKFWQVAWKEMPPSPAKLDLTQYVGEKFLTVYRGAIDAGNYDGIHLKLKNTLGILKKNQRETAVKNMIGPVKLAFSVSANTETMIVLDLVVLDMSDHPPRGYELNLKGYEIYQNGKLVDKLPPG